MNIEIEYVDSLGSSPIMVLKNDTQIVILVNKNMPVQMQDAYIAIVRSKLSED